MSFRIPWIGSKERRTKDEALKWILRQDRGLTEDELLELQQRLRSDPGFRSAFNRHTRAWSLLDGVSPEMAQIDMVGEPSRPLFLRPVWREFGIAALLVLGFSVFWWSTHRPSTQSLLYFSETRSTLDPWTQRLPDGSVIRLNAGAKIQVRYTPELRKVELLSGEAHFSVAKQLDRPFAVIANQVEVQAVGTVFNVRYNTEKVDVLVTEGTVKIASINVREPKSVENGGDLGNVTNNKENFLSSGQRAVISMGVEKEEAIQVGIFETESLEVSEILEWQKKLLTLGGDSLEEIAASFEQKTGLKLIITDPELNDLKIGGQFPSEDVKGFLQVLKSGYGIQWSEKSDGTLVVGDRN